MFDLADKGYGAGKISKELTDRLIPCPAYFIYEKHGGYKHIFEAEDGLSKKYNWYIGGVKRILSNKTYLGHSIHFRSGNLSYKIRKRVRNDKDDILIVENTHEPIISVEQYKRVQRLRESRTRVSKSGEINLFAQIIKCGTCGKSMSWYRHPGNKANNYGCREFRERG
ncbi:MAG: recombinase family protein [Erysipelotrichaceae bacterium]|nr:recombinase family protein [Erysipelotrichaceae bacterium]